MNLYVGWIDGSVLMNLILIWVNCVFDFVEIGVFFGFG